jgi:hypothetical protein
MSHNINGNSFEITGSLLALKFIAFWGVAPFNVLDYMSNVGEYVIELHVILKCVSIYFE